MTNFDNFKNTGAALSPWLKEAENYHPTLLIFIIWWKVQVQVQVQVHTSIQNAHGVVQASPPSQYHDKPKDNNNEDKNFENWRKPVVSVVL